MPKLTLTISCTLLCTALFAQQKGTFTDTRDGKTYKTVKIGEQVWMAENLNYKVKGSKCYGEGRIIYKFIESDEIELSDAEIQANCEKYGSLYDFETAKKVCPKGWNLPSPDEWDILFRYADTTSYTDDDAHNNYDKKIVGKFLKTTSGWNDYEDYDDKGEIKSGNGEDRYGFSALPGGRNSLRGHSRDIGDRGHWWTSSIYYPSLYIHRNYMNYDYNDVIVLFDGPPDKDLYSVRCLQTNTQPQKIIPPACPANDQQKGTFTDARDGKEYKTVKICEQTWMSENLNYEAEGSKCFGEGGKIFNSKTKKDDITLSKAEIQANCKKYGRMYNWETAMKVCPDGWHLPSNAEWDKLYRFADGTSGTKRPYMSKTAGKFLKAKSGWKSEDGKSGNGEDKYGFSALPGGLGNSDGSFADFGAYWWSSSRYAYQRSIQHRSGYAYWKSGGSNQSLSVRCIQD
ncbi:MAG: hypothetical protein LBC87_08750 [Fibromonadaceae bacterium]|nr:hypothetical protein [Fibromonadaceae bacterium]